MSRAYIFQPFHINPQKGRVVEFDETFTEKYFQIIEEGQDLEIRQRIFYSEKDDVKDHYQLEHEMNRGSMSIAGTRHPFQCLGLIID